MTADPKPTAGRRDWWYLVHVGANMWGTNPERPVDRRTGRPGYAPHLRCDDGTWRTIVDEAVAAGFTGVVLDLGDAIAYESHPEIAVTGAWSTTRLREELAHLRELGLEPLPKLNFSTSHGAWLGVYSRMVSTPVYYEVVGDLIAEVANLFDTPRFFHLGMDEELITNQAGAPLVVLRQGELWQHDSLHLFDCVRKTGSRPWVWSDPAWADPESYYGFMPKDVVQSNWHYGLWFEAEDHGRPRDLKPFERYLAYLDLDERGYDQVPTTSSWRNAWDNFGASVRYCEEHLSKPPLAYLHSSWNLTIPERLHHHVETLRRAKDVIDGVTA